jgi:hypothetical protein
MLQSLQTFWISAPPDPAIPFILWRGFRQEMFGWMSGATVVGVALIILFYVLWCRKIVIRSPVDPFSTFTPMRWLFLAFGSGLAAGIAYAVRYKLLFPGASISPIGGSMTAFFLVTLVTYLVSQLLIWLPGVTPRKLIYHPRWLWRLLRRNPGETHSA